MQIKNFGCKLNHYDSLLIKKQLKGFKPATIKGKSLFILNSCTVTAQAGRTVRKEAEKIKKSHPESLLVVTGCGAQTETELYAHSKFVDLVVGNSDKGRLREIIEGFSAKSKVFKSNIFKSKDLFSGFVSPAEDRTRAFVKIQDGCDSFCTFCIIPFARGRSQSVGSDFIVSALKRLEKKGIKEAVLTGVHIGDYQDAGIDLPRLLCLLLEKTHIPRIRLSSLEPVEITDQLLDCYKDERLCPHFHISLQSASSSVLKTMKRTYGQTEVEEAFERIRLQVPHAFIGMDLIAGFPTETEKDFQTSYDLLSAEPCWSSIHVFPYSPRKGTYSALRYKSLPQSEISRRAGLFRELSQDRFLTQLKKQKGTRKKVLRFKTNKHKGLSRDYWTVALPPPSDGSSFLDQKLMDQKPEREVLIEGFDETSGQLKGVFLNSRS